MPNSPLTEGYHTPAMIQEVRSLLSLLPGDTFIDATLGNGGHAASLLDMTAPNGELLGLDADPEMLVQAKKRLRPYSNRIILVNDNFSNLWSVAERADFRTCVFSLMSSAEFVKRKLSGVNGSIRLELPNARD